MTTFVVSSSFEEELANVLRPWLKDLVASSEAKARELADNDVVQRRTNEYYESFNSGVRRSSESSTGEAGWVGNSANHAAAIEEGTAAHEIRARPDNPTGRLHFQVGGVWVSPKKVNHPGTKPTELIHRAIEAAFAEAPK